MGKVHMCSNTLRSLIVRHEFLLVVILSMGHIGLSYTHSRESGTLNQLI